MCCDMTSTISTSISKRKQSALRITALALCVSILMVFFLSTAFIFTNANHEHDHSGPNGSCATCIHIASAENLLKQLSTAIISASFIIGSLFGILFLLNPTTNGVDFFTLVSLKVRMNN